jgi:rhamnogalacturonan endolyase
MKKLLLILCLVCFGYISLQAQRQMEKLSRGLVAVKVSNGVFLSWRILGTEWSGVSYNLYRGSTKIASITGASNYLDASGTTSSTYYIKAVVGGVEQTASSTVSVWSTFYKTIPITPPAGGTTPDGVSYTYTANDCSVGDLDGDGEYEIVLKWEPTNAKDPSQSGYTGKVYLDGIELDGTRKWRIDLGINIRAGAHYNPFIVYDLNGDGKAEVVCKGADGTKDNAGTILGSSTADYRNSSGYILSGPEYLCIFSGASGNLVKYVSYNPPRGTVSDWGDTYGNRVDRFLAGVAYLDGVKPYLIMCRGYYTGVVNGVTYGQTWIVAYNYTANTLTQKWAFSAKYGGTNSSYTGQGNHNLSIADVDGDGYDEIVYGAMCVDHNGVGKYTTGYGHGDAMHLSDLDPDRSGLEVWQCHEGGSGATFRNANSSSYIWKYSNSGDVGRALAADIDANYKGAECWAAGSPLYTCKGVNIGTAPSSINFAIWWDGDLSRELLDGTKLDKWVNGALSRLVTLYNYESATACNGSKNTPNLQADIIGDWREEVILHSSDNTKLILFTTTTITSTKMYTLMHDKVYRLGIAWQNVGYNQPPHLSFYFGNGMGTIPSPNITLKSEEVEPTSIAFENINKDNKIILSPNPVSNFADVTINLSESSNVKISVIDITGKLLYQQDLGYHSAGTFSQPLSFDNLRSGTYLLQVYAGSYVQATSFIKK